jgi:CBS domain-containing protein
MAIAGPGMSFVIAVVCAAAVVLLALLGVPETWWTPLEFLGFMNLALAVFNLLPGFPLDGGRVLRAGLWALTGDLLKATRWAAAAGRGFGWLMVGGGLYAFAAPALGLPGLGQDAVGSLWLVVLGWFLMSMASRAYADQKLRSTLSGVSVGQVMLAPAPVLPADEAVETARSRRAFGPRYPFYALVRDGDVVGLVSGSDIDRAAATRAEARVAELDDVGLEERIVRAEAGLDELLGRMAPDRPDGFIVTHGDRLAGIVTRADVIRVVQGLRSGR